MKCVHCAGKGCPACGDSGYLKIDQCPHELLDSDTCDALQLSRIAADGTWPESGGLLDQTASFVTAYDAIQIERRIYGQEKP